MVHLLHLVRMFTLGDQHQVDPVGDDLLKIFQSQGKLVDPDHPFGPVKIDLAQGVPHQDPCLLFPFRGHRILQVQDNPVRMVDSRIDHQAGGIAGEVEPGEPEPVTAAS